MLESSANPNPLDTSEVRILAATWNMMGRDPILSDLHNLLHPDSIHHDLYFIGSQESLHTIAGSMFAPSKEALNDLIGVCLGENFKMISSVSLQATHLVVFAHIQIIPLISQISYDDYATGFQNTLGNKGGVTIRFKLAQTSIRVITSHFHSGQHNLAARNRDINEIFQAFCTNQPRGQRN